MSQAPQCKHGKPERGLNCQLCREDPLRAAVDRVVHSFLDDPMDMNGMYAMGDKVMRAIAPFITHSDHALEGQATAWREIAGLFDVGPVGISYTQHVKNTILATRAERDKLLGFYTEIVKELGDDLVLKRILDLTKELETSRQFGETCMRSALRDKDQQITDLRAQIAKLEVDILALRGHSDGVDSTIEGWQEDARELAKEFPGVDWFLVKDFIPHIRALRTALNIALTALEDIGTSAHCIAKTGPDIDNVWGKLMGINVKATYAIGQVRAARDGN